MLLESCPSLLCPTTSLSLLSCSPTSLPLHTGQPSPFILHCLAISVFASTFGPVAGFLCSGFKRACSSKNFGSLIPGHGGVLDRWGSLLVILLLDHFTA